MSHCNISVFSYFMQSHLIVWNPFSFRMSFLTSILITNHFNFLMFSVIIYSFNALNASHCNNWHFSPVREEKNTRQVVFSSRILIEYVEMTMSWYNDMNWWWYWLSYQRKAIFFQEKCYSVAHLFLENFFQRYDRSGRWPNMFFVVVGTRPRCIINEFAWAARINI